MCQSGKSKNAVNRWRAALENLLDHQVACRRWQEFRSDARTA
jgi:hypothetical protein